MYVYTPVHVYYITNDIIYSLYSYSHTCLLIKSTIGYKYQFNRWHTNITAVTKHSWITNN